MLTPVGRRVAVACVVLLTAAGCNRAPTAPGSEAVDVSGTWAGSASDTTGFGDLLWRVTQADGTFQGSVEITDRSVGITGRGTVSGSITGGLIQFTLTVPVAGFSEPFDSCSTTVTGQATAGTTALAGLYAGASTCSGTIYSGQLVLRRL